MLYEGNYDDWIDKATTMLLLEGYWTLSLDGNTTDKSKADALRLVRRYVRPQLLDRIADEEKGSVDRLLAGLRKLANPFRFLDLPAELRTDVYSCILGYEAMLRIPSGKSERGDRSAGSASQPSLTMVSRQLRNETLPLYYQLNSFKLDLHHKDLITSTAKEVLDWALANKLWMKHLRRLTVFFRFQQATTNVPSMTVSYEPATGLKLDNLANVGFEDTFRHRVSHAEGHRRTHGLEGKGIILAFFDDVNMWQVLRKIVETKQAAAGAK